MDAKSPKVWVNTLQFEMCPGKASEAVRVASHSRQLAEGGRMKLASNQGTDATDEMTRRQSGDC